VAGPSAITGAPGWLVALVGVGLAAIIGVAGMQVYRRRR
jgi:hypothetical protein